MMGWGSVPWSYAVGLSTDILASGSNWWPGLIALVLQGAFWIVLVVIDFKLFRSNFGLKVRVDNQPRENPLDISLDDMLKVKFPFQNISAVNVIWQIINMIYVPTIYEFIGL